MATIHLVSGPIGAGKTTKALAIVRDTKAVLMSPDNWMADSGIPLRHSDIRAVIEEAQWSISALLLGKGHDVVIEWGTWSRQERIEILTKAKALGHNVAGYFLTPDLNTLIQRVESREANWPDSDRVTSDEVASAARSFENPKDDELELYAETWFSD